MPSPNPLALRKAVAALWGGGVIACPTEAVWGLSCDPWSEAAVRRLLALKQRPMHKGLILVAGDASHFEFLLEDLPARQRSQLALSWPGPATWLVPHRDRVPSWVTGAHGSVAIRVSAHPGVRALCDAFGGPLVSTSANPASAQPARALYQVMRYFGTRLDAVLPGQTGGQRRPTPIRDLATGRTVRA